MRTDIHEGMTIRSADGEKLGKVITLEAGYFVIEKGIFFPKDYLVRYEDVTRLDEEGKEAFLARNKDELREIGKEEAEREPIEPARAETARPATGTEETRIPLEEEEVVVGKQMEEAGRVRVKKEVVTEEQKVTVPVTREEVRVERVPAAGQRAEGEFIEEEVTIPVREERVSVGKRPVVREEVRVAKTPVEEEHTETETLRKEKAEIEREGMRAPGRDEDKKI